MDLAWHDIGPRTGEALIAPLYLRLLVTDVPIDADYADRVLDLVLRVHGHRAT